MTLNVRHMSHRPLKEWWYLEQSIDFAPLYQRKGSIWSIGTQQRLIDTVLNGFDIPKVYLADFSYSERTLDQAGVPYAVIDGKQRLQTLFAFFKGTLKLNRNFVLFDHPTWEMGGYTYDQLINTYPDVASRFSNFQLTVMSVVTDDELYINELFLRLNASSNLTGAEKRNAMVGEVPKLIRKLVAHRFFTRKVSFNTVRGQDANTAAKLLLIEHAGGPVDTKKVHLDRLVADPGKIKSSVDLGVESKRTLDGMESFIGVSQDTESVDVMHSAGIVSKTLDTMTEVFREEDPLLSAQAQIPIIYLVVRRIADDELRYFRDFLVHFQKIRETNRSASAAAKDVEISDYELFNRSSNDQGSIEGRFKIMLKRFKLFIESSRQNDFDSLLG